MLPGGLHLSDAEASRTALERALERAVRSAGLTHEAARSVAADACRLDAAGGDMGVKELLAEMNDRDRDRVRSITAALRRLQSGRYGICEACGRPIEQPRLEIIPETTCCSQCAE